MCYNFLMWFYLVSLSGLIFTIRQLLARMILRDESDSLAYTFTQQTMTALMILPILFFNWQIPERKILLFYLFLVGVWDTLSSFLITESLRHLEISWRTIIYQSRIIWLIILGSLLLGEVLNWQKFLGGGLIFLGVVLATWRKERVGRLKLLWQRLQNGQSTEKERGILITLAAAFSTSFQLMAVRYLLNFFSSAVLILGLAGTSSLILALIMGNLKARVLRLPRLSFLNGALGMMGGLFFFLATAMTEVTRTVPITNAFAVLTVVFGIVFLRERESWLRKILGSLLAVVGVILVKIA